MMIMMIIDDDEEEEKEGKETRTQVIIRSKYVYRTM